MRAVLEVLAKKRPGTMCRFCCLGENGTGKSALARRIHQLSGRNKQPFAVINCPTLSEELLASELFGHTKGAFTGAVKDQRGRVEAADGGTLFLDEIGELSPSLQAEAFALCPRQTVRAPRRGQHHAHRRCARFSGDQPQPTQPKSRVAVFARTFFFASTLLSSRCRRYASEKKMWCRWRGAFSLFFARTGQRLPVSELTPETEEGHFLCSHTWPGNVRELRNAMERAAIF